MEIDHVIREMAILKSKGEKHIAIGWWDRHFLMNEYEKGITPAQMERIATRIDNSNWADKNEDIAEIVAEETNED